MNTDKELSYDKLVKFLKNLPLTWYHAILGVLVEECVRRKVFLPNKLCEFVSKIEKRALEKQCEKS